MKGICPVLNSAGHYFGGVSMTEKQIIEAIKRIVERGNNAEVKRRKDGSLVVYEVKKSIAVQ